MGNASLLTTMPIHSVWLINKAGGLCYQRIFDDSLHPRLSTNDFLVMASTFQSIHAIASKVSPVPGCSGIRQVELYATGTMRPFRIHCFQSPTGVKVLLTATSSPADKKSSIGSSSPEECDALLRRVYEVYADWAVKNPFQAVEMPVRSEGFERALQRLILTGQYSS